MKTLIPFIFFIIFVTTSQCDPQGWRRPPPPTDPPGPTGPTEEDVRAFKEWQEHFAKEYTTDVEEEEALAKLLENKAKIDEHNAKFEEGEVSFTRGLFKYSDLTAEEKQQRLTGLAVPPSEKSRATKRSLPASIYPPGAASVDWRKEGLVGPVLDQGWCNSCWAFSAAGVMDAVLRRKNITVQVSPQQLVDCSSRFCWGCQSGWPKYALDYVRDNGIAREVVYPYKGETQNCTYNKVSGISYVSNVYNIPTRGNETWLRDIVASVGPVSIAMCLADSFYNYQSGVYYEEDCCKDIMHAMLLVGYGTDRVGGDYWIVKNTWGDSWGEKGYIRVARNSDNMCNIAYYAVYAT